MPMARTIMVSDEVYEELRRAKLPGESFSEVIRRLLGSRPRIFELAGKRTITKEEWEKVLTAFSEQRNWTTSGGDLLGSGITTLLPQ